MFELISSDKLVPGTKYIIYSNYQFIGVFQYTFIKDIIRLQFDKLNNVTTEIKLVHPWHFYPSDKFYTFVSQNPQWQMERRSVNIILRRLIGDDCFTW